MKQAAPKSKLEPFTESLFKIAQKSKKSVFRVADQAVELSKQGLKHEEILTRLSKL